MKKNKINILISINNEYIEHAEDLIYSIIQFNSVFINLFLIYDDSLNEDNIDRLSKFLEKNNYGKLYKLYFDNNIDSSFQNIDYISVNTYFRLFAPFILKGKYNIDKILYLDCDIICTGNIIDFYNTDFDDNIIIGCRNMLKEEIKLWTVTLNINLGIPINHPYINAGVLLININEYVKRVSFDDVNLFLKNNIKKLLLQDQDAINKLFYDKIKVESNIYNYQINPSEENYKELDIRLVHYSERKKPWNLDYDNIEKAIYYYKLLKSREKTQELEKIIFKHYQNVARNFYNDILDDKI